MRGLSCLSLIVSTLFSACGVVDYENAPEGEFSGSLLVMWVGESGPLGDGRFVYVPSETRPLKFTRNTRNREFASIEPGMMYTDGGSIPRQAQFFTGFSPWGYAPAYMVHDWIFVARHCLNDGTASEDHKKLEAMTFQESAEVMAETIKTLIRSGKVKKNEVAPAVISGVVAGPFSYERWNAKGACAQDQVSQDHKDEVEAALARKRGLRLLRRGEAVPPAQIVAEIEF